MQGIKKHPRLRPRHLEVSEYVPATRQKDIQQRQSNYLVQDSARHAAKSLLEHVDAAYSVVDNKFWWMRR